MIQFLNSSKNYLNFAFIFSQIWFFSALRSRQHSADKKWHLNATMKLTVWICVLVKLVLGITSYIDIIDFQNIRF